MKKVLYLLLLAVIMSCATQIPYIPGVKNVKNKIPPQVLEWYQDGAVYDLQKDLFIPFVDGEEVTFVFVSDEAEKVVFSSSINQYSKEDELHQWENTSLFWKSYTIPQGTEVRYQFHVTNKEGSFFQMKDPFNPVIPKENIRHSFLQIPREGEGRLWGLPGVPVPPGAPLRPRLLYLYLPSAYFSLQEKDFPVLYMMDGQNLWDSPHLPYGGWKLDTILDRLIQEEKIPPIIVVGVPNTSQRNPEFMGITTHFGNNDPDLLDLKEKQIAQGKAFQKHLVEEIKPFIDQNFRTSKEKENTFVGGSSFGAGVSLQLMVNYPEIFGGLLAMSLGQYNPETSVQWATRPFALQAWFEEKGPQKWPSSRLYLDCGTASVDQAFWPYAERIYKKILSTGFPQSDIRWVLEEEAEHNEDAWAKRLPQALSWLLGPQ